MIEIKSAHAASALEQITGLLAVIISWPVTLIVFMVIFRNQISRLIDGLEEVSGFGPTLKRRLNSVAEKLSEAEAEAVTPVTITATGTARGSSTAVAESSTVYPDSASQASVSTSPTLAGSTEPAKAISPQERILRSWLKVEERVRQVAAVQGLDTDTPAALWESAKQLRKTDVFDGRIIGLLSHLRKLRDQAAEGGAVSAEDAARYAGFVSRLLGLIRAVGA